MESQKINCLKYGNPESFPAPQILHAGKLTMVYDSGNIRYISIGNTETIRMIYSAVRNEYWETIEPVISNESIGTSFDSFAIEYSCRYVEGGIDFEAKYHIKGNSDGSFSFEMYGVAKSDFTKNRIGFCVLHPVNEYAGKTVIIEHPDGSKTQSEFPVLISPHQPFKNIRSMKAFFSPANYTLLNFTGDVFETEDQRNWTDGSFKTYCTPLDNPKPVSVKRGEQFYQKVELMVASEGFRAEKTRNNNAVVISIETEKTLPFPGIGICRSNRIESIKEDEINVIKLIPFNGYRVEIYLSKDSWRKNLESAYNESEKLGFPLECALILKNGDFKNTDNFIALATRFGSPPSVLYLFGEDCHCLNMEFVNSVSLLLKNSFPITLIGCGTNANFAQLNREKPVNTNCDFITYSIHPQEHASDNLSLIENTEAQKYTIESAFEFSRDLPVHVSPVTLKRRFNANNEFFEPESTTGGRPEQVDPRQSSLFAACWTLSSLKYLAEAGVKSVNYYETVGERGIIQGNFPVAFPVGNYQTAGTIFPVYILLKFLLNLPQKSIVRTISSKSLEVDCFGVFSRDRLHLIIWNYKDESNTADLSYLPYKLEYIIINVDLYLNNMFRTEWLESLVYKEVSELNKFNLSPCSIVLLRSF